VRALVIASIAALGVSGCANLRALGVKTPDVNDLSNKVEEKAHEAGDKAKAGAEATAAEIQKAVGAFTSALPDAEKACAPLKNRKVPWEEEREIGGAVALSLASQGNGYFIELSKDLPTHVLTASERDGLKDAHVTPPVGDKAKLNHYVNLVGQYLTIFSQRPGLPWTFVVLDSPEANAFSAPGGYVFVTTGLLKLTDNEAQLAAALGHEIGHVQARDAINAYQKSKYEACRVSIALSAVMDQLPGFHMKDVEKLQGLPKGIKDIAASLTKEEMKKSADEMRAVAKGDKPFDPSAGSAGLVMLISDITSWWINNTGYAAENEYKADGVARDLMSVAGYDTDQFGKLLAKLKDGGGFLSPHPSNKDRMAKFNEGNDFKGTASAPDNADKLKLVKK